MFVKFVFFYVAVHYSQPEGSYLSDAFFAICLYRFVVLMFLFSPLFFFGSLNRIIPQSVCTRSPLVFYLPLPQNNCLPLLSLRLCLQSVCMRSCRFYPLYSCIVLIQFLIFLSRYLCSRMYLLVNYQSSLGYFGPCDCQYFSDFQHYA